MMHSTTMHTALMPRLFADSVGDASSSRLLVGVALILALLGVVLLGLAYWVFRTTQYEPDVLAPLEVMGTSAWINADAETRRQLLAAARRNSSRTANDPVRSGGGRPSPVRSKKAPARATTSERALLAFDAPSGAPNPSPAAGRSGSTAPKSVKGAAPSATQPARPRAAGAVATHGSKPAAGREIPAKPDRSSESVTQKRRIREEVATATPQVGSAAGSPPREGKRPADASKGGSVPSERVAGLAKPATARVPDGSTPKKDPVPSRAADSVGPAAAIPFSTPTKPRAPEKLSAMASPSATAKPVPGVDPLVKLRPVTGEEPSLRAKPMATDAAAKTEADAESSDSAGAVKAKPARSATSDADTTAKG